MEEAAAFHLSELVLLAVGRVPDPVHEEVGDVHGREDGGVPSVDGRVVVGEVDRAVAVAERHVGPHHRLQKSLPLVLPRLLRPHDHAPRSAGYPTLPGEVRRGLERIYPEGSLSVHPGELSVHFCAGWQKRHGLTKSFSQYVI